VHWSCPEINLCESPPTTPELSWPKRVVLSLSASDGQRKFTEENHLRRRAEREREIEGEKRQLGHNFLLKKKKIERGHLVCQLHNIANENSREISLRFFLRLFFFASLDTHTDTYVHTYVYNWFLYNLSFSVGDFWSCSRPKILVEFSFFIAYFSGAGAWIRRI